MFISLGEEIPITYLFNSSLKIKSKLLFIILFSRSIKIFTVLAFPIALGISENSSIFLLLISNILSPSR